MLVGYNPTPLARPTHQHVHVHQTAFMYYIVTAEYNIVGRGPSWATFAFSRLNAMVGPRPTKYNVLYIIHTLSDEFCTDTPLLTSLATLRRLPLFAASRSSRSSLPEV